MLAGRYDIIADQGSTLQRDLKYFDGAGDPVDLTGYTAAMQVRENYGSTATVLSLSSEGTAPAITLGTTIGSGALAAMIELTTNDFVELWITNTTSSENPTVVDATLAMMN